MREKYRYIMIDTVKSNYQEVNIFNKIKLCNKYFFKK